MRNFIVVLLLIFLNSAFSQSWQWSNPIALTDSVTDNINVSFINANDYDWIEYNYMLWERNFGDSSTIMLMKPSQPDSEFVICTSPSGIRYTNPIGQFSFFNTVFIIWQSNQNGNYDLYGGFWSGTGISGFHQITTNSLDDVNPALSGDILVWERAGKIITKNITIMDTALFWWDSEVIIDSMECANPVIRAQYEKYIAYEKTFDDSSLIYITWNSNSIWHEPVCLYAEGDNRSLSTDQGYSDDFWWKHKKDSDWNIMGCMVHDLFNDTIFVYDTIIYNFSNFNEINPTTIMPIFVTNEKKFIYTNLAFESDSTGNKEIFYVNDIFFSSPLNISQNITQDILPQFSEIGWMEAQNGSYRIWLAWQSLRNGHWQIWCRYADIPLMNIENESDIIPGQYQLYQNYPNPFNSQTFIKYYLPQSGQVKIEIYNVLGQKVKTLLSQTQKSGQHHVIWDGRDENNKPVSSGVYIYNLKVSRTSFSKKLLLLK